MTAGTGIADGATIASIERQAKDHGYITTSKVERSGVAVVTLKSSYTPIQTFEADSGTDVTSSRYETALVKAVDRMLDYEYRSKWDTRPQVGARPNYG